MPGSENRGAFSRAVTSLAQIEDRLRRNLGLVGEVGTEFTPAAIPVILCGDATAAGNNQQRGRRFQFGSATKSVISPVQRKFQAQADIVIDEMIIHATAISAGGIHMRWIPPGTTGDAASYIIASGMASTWTERQSSSANDAPPILMSASGTAAIGKVWMFFPETPSVWPQFPIRDVFIPQGGAFSFENTGAETTTNFCVYGRGYVY